MKPTVVLVHGAYAESSSWNGVLEPLTTAGHRVIAFATPLRGVASDAALLSDLIRTLDGPVVLVGHSYGGAGLTNTALAAAPRLDPGRDSRAGSVGRRRLRHLHRSGEIPPSVRRRPARGAGPLDGR